MKKINSIQALRGIAATLVVFFHAQMLAHRYEDRYGLAKSFLNLTDATLMFGSCGVDIFFVISGVIMAYITYDRYQTASASTDFIKRRIIRIVPLYWLYTIILAVLLFFFPKLFNTASFDLRGLILSLLFIPYTPSAANMAPVLSVGWSLSYEMYFYLLIAIGLFFPRKQFLICLICLFFVSVAFRPFYSGPVANVLTNPMLLEFLAGFIAGTVFMSRRNIPMLFSCFLILLAVLFYTAWLININWGVINLGLPSVLFVSGVFFLEKSLKMKFPGWIIKLGNSSYTLYLSHFILLPGVGKISFLLGFFDYLSPTIFIFFSSVICCISGYVLYKLIEVPLLSFFQKRYIA